MTFSDEIKNYLKDSGITQKELADRLGVDVAQINRTINEKSGTKRKSYTRMALENLLSEKRERELFLSNLSTKELLEELERRVILK